VSAVPHATFKALAPDLGQSHPPGALLARRLEEGLRSCFAEVGSRDNWRDCGWSIDVRSGGVSVQVYFAPFSPEDHWLLAAAPIGAPGFFARMLGRKPMPCASELLAVSSAVHGIMVNIPEVTGLQWMFGGPPERVPRFSRPEELPWHAAP
jgi:hypothetical protein